VTEKLKAGLQSNGILAVPFHKVDMGSIYFCSITDINC